MAKKKKWKKRIKKALKGAAIAGGALLAAKALKGRGTSSPFLASGAAGGARLPKGDAYARAKRLMTTDDAYTDQYQYDPIRTGGVGVKYSPPRVWNQDQSMTDNNPFIYKKGGRVGVGKAKRGFGRALKKGRK
jgi:hypothetical protein